MLRYSSSLHMATVIVATAIVVGQVLSLSSDQNTAPSGVRTTVQDSKTIHELHPLSQWANPGSGRTVEFGRSIASYRGLVVVGSRIANTQRGSIPDHDKLLEQPGLVHLYTQTEGKWQHTASISTPDDGNKADDFGFRLAVVDYELPSRDKSGTEGESPSEDLDLCVLVGSPQTTYAKGTGRVDVYCASGNWTRREAWKPDDLEAGDHFGASLAGAGSLAAVGAHWNAGVGAVYTFDSGRSRGKLSRGDDGDRYGFSIALHDTCLAIGAPGRAPAGAVDLWCIDPADLVSGKLRDLNYAPTWRMVAEMAPPSTTGGEQFGWAVALSREWAAVAGLRGVAGNITEAGRVAVYRIQSLQVQDRQDVHLVQVLQRPDTPQPYDRFGWAVAIREGSSSSSLGPALAVATVWADHNGNSNQGVVYLYALSNSSSSSTWEPHARLSVPSGRALDEFGGALAHINSTLFVGAQGVDSEYIDDGAVYEFDLDHHKGDPGDPGQKGSEKSKEELIIAVSLGLAGLFIVVGSAIITYAFRSRTSSHQYQPISQQLDQFDPNDV
eukprot:TRINITY_DN4786_c0_g1_i1.p1 TRINITY_DN4786_c0_g1~~TRINITY_DN4786_c0_g1_i1.p1  ORF type:complete len:553 (-),score=102.03 TRINITY_DN4786_c0_g1_i1:38-1696(-)